MPYFLLLVSALLIALNYSIRRHFNRLLPTFRIDSHHGPLQLRRYSKLTVAEVRVTGGTSLALRSGRQLLDKYFRDEGISRFALPILAEKIDSADSIWSMAAVSYTYYVHGGGCCTCITVCACPCPCTLCGALQRCTARCTVRAPHTHCIRSCMLLHGSSAAHRLGRRQA